MLHLGDAFKKETTRKESPSPAPTTKSETSFHPDQPSITATKSTTCTPARGRDASRENPGRSRHGSACLPHPRPEQPQHITGSSPDLALADEASTPLLPAPQPPTQTPASSTARDRKSVV